MSGERKYADNSITLRDAGTSGEALRTFMIIDIMDKNSKGGFVVSYDAFCSGLGRGILKEFYPEKFCGSFERDHKGQLNIVLNENIIKKEADNYLRPYYMLEEAKSQSDDDSLSTFIPTFQIFSGLEKNSTVYIWSPDSKVEPFDKICSDIRSDIADDPTGKLRLILKVIKELAECTGALHREGIIHRDIKPANFGLKKRNGELCEQYLSMFDINSLCHKFKLEDKIFSDGYKAPELDMKKNSELTDIYSIGATLFTAAIITEETRKDTYLYKDEYFDELDSMTEHSELIRASEDNYYYRVRKQISYILKRCLDPIPENRFGNCEEIAAAAAETLKYLGSAWENKAEQQHKISEKNSFLSFMYHLYEYPIYKWAEDDDINILIIGFGKYGQSFLDTCLQTGQMAERDLCVNVITKDPIDKEMYLKDRPALTDFFDIDGGDTAGSYGKICFGQPMTISENNCLSELDGYIKSNFLYPPAYIFIALGNDEFSAKTAACLKTHFGSRIHICYACESPSDDPDAICVYKNIKEHPVHKEIERMAYNNHLLWNKSLNVDFKAVYKEFKAPYNYDSCIASVTAMKYRLYSIGIDMDKCTLEEAAEKFYTEISAKSIMTYFKKKLIMYEHRRWVTEKICKGWTCSKDIAYCAEHDLPKDEKHKKHICILKSSSDTSLFDLTHADWDKDTLPFVPDDLDKLSLEMHKAYSRKAAEVKREHSDIIRSLISVREEISGCIISLKTFNEWYACIKSIWEGDDRAFKLYSGLKSRFFETLSRLPKDRSDIVKHRIACFENIFRPVYESLTYKDYKKEDAVIIQNIPFILTYTTDISLIVPLNTGSVSEWFENVAAAAVINPRSIVYMLDLKSTEQFEPIYKAIKYISSFLERKHMQGKFTPAITIMPDCISEREKEEFSQKIKHIGCGRIKNLAFIYAKESEKSKKRRKYIKRLFSANKNYALIKNSTPLSSELEKDGIFTDFPSCSFNSAEQKFTDLNGCKKFEYIRPKTHITAEDLDLALDRGAQPEFYEDCPILEKLYFNNINAWNDLCNTLSRYCGKKDHLAALHKNAAASHNIVSYILPSHCRMDIKRLINQLIQAGYLGTYFSDSSFSMDSFTLEIDDIYSNKKSLDNVFGNVYLLGSTKAVINDETTLNIVCDNLKVENVRADSGKAVLTAAAELGYIIDLRDNGGNLSFTFASSRIKKLFTDKNSIREILVYHKAKKNGCDDAAVLSGNISCCVITQGFSSVFVNTGCSDIFDLKGINSVIKTFDEILYQ